jgi:hypothetical protein
MSARKCRAAPCQAASSWPCADAEESHRRFVVAEKTLTALLGRRRHFHGGACHVNTLPPSLALVLSRFVMSSYCRDLALSRSLAGRPRALVLALSRSLLSSVSCPTPFCLTAPPSPPPLGRSLAPLKARWLYTPRLVTVIMLLRLLHTQCCTHPPRCLLRNSRQLLSLLMIAQLLRGWGGCPRFDGDPNAPVPSLPVTFDMMRRLAQPRH